MNPTSATPEKASLVPLVAPAIAKAPSQKKEKKPVAKKSAAKKTVSKKASKDGVNKSEEIRKVARELQAKGEAVRPKTIVEILNKRGIKIAPPQASMVLKAAGFRPGRRKRRAGAAAGPVTRKTNTKDLSVSDLLKAKKMAEDFGGAVKLVNALSALVELR